MLRIILSGCCGSMGAAVASCAKSIGSFEIVTGIDAKNTTNEDFPVVSHPDEVSHEADVLIDFSNPTLLDSLLEFCVVKHVAAVLCTTGYSKEQVKKIELASKQVPVFYSGNMSLGVNLLIELSKTAAKVLGDSFDIEIVEKHHNRKLDAPSGTALMIADGISSALGKEMHYVYDRHSQRKPRENTDVGIHSIRGGTIVGEHDVIFAGQHEVITLSHSAQSRDIFALGALNAATFLSRQGVGLYSMPDLLK